MKFSYRMHIIFAKFIGNKYFWITSSIKFLIFFHKTKLWAPTVVAFGMLCQHDKAEVKIGQGQKFFQSSGNAFMT